MTVNVEQKMRLDWIASSAHMHLTTECLPRWPKGSGETTVLKATVHLPSLP